MKSEEELANEYPDIFELWHKDPDDLDAPAPQMAIFGFQHGEGWHGIIESLCEVLDRIEGDITVTQSKEKFGGLRFYYSGISTENEQDAMMVMGAVRQAERMSFHVCEECGSPAELRHGGYYRTLCDECD